MCSLLNLTTQFPARLFDGCRAARFCGLPMKIRRLKCPLRPGEDAGTRAVN